MEQLKRVFVSLSYLGKRNFISLSRSIMSLNNDRRCVHCTAPRSADYESAVQMLNSLQSNMAVLQAIRKERGRFAERNISQVVKFLSRVGIEVEELDHLKIIHVSGTKGKGSTTSFCESVLRNHGYRTGFYSSPHLVEARERIRINGQPISQGMFSFYFWKVYNELWEKRESDADMPAYFKFLTIMAFYTFLKEKVDVAIIEVGIGGQYDCTNVIKNPVVCGVTSLGHDHTNILGSTLDKIAWQKGGIFKPGAPAFTVCQPSEAMDVLVQRAKEQKVPLYEVPPLNEPVAGLSSYIQYINASLAIQLCHAWIDIQTKGFFQPDTAYGSDNTFSKLPISLPVSVVTDRVANGLRKCFWPGRTQVMRKGPVTYFLDGAHTAESIEACVQWFKNVSRKEHLRVGGKVFKVLVFNLSGDRMPEDTIQPLVSCQFDMVIFCPNFAHVSLSGSSDQIAVASSWEMQMERCTHNNNVWKKFTAFASANTTEAQSVESCVPSLSQTVPTTSKTAVFPSICDVLKWLSRVEDTQPQTSNPDAIPCALPSKELAAADQVQVLVTGSLLLVGGFLGLMDPTLKGSSSDNLVFVPKLAVSGSQHILNGIHRKMISTCCVPGTP